MGNVAHSLPCGQKTRALLFELRIALDVGKRRAIASAADAAEAAAQVENEGFPLLLPVRDHIDADCALLG